MNKKVVQDKYVIPDDIEIGIAIGMYKRSGSIIRYATGPKKGQFVKFLDPVDDIKKHKKMLFITMTASIVAGTGILLYKKLRKKEYEIVSEFRKELRIYIDAIREGCMDSNKINNLIKEIERLKKHDNYKKIVIQLTAEDLYILVEHIREYTKKLASDNDIKLSDNALNVPETNDTNVIVNLQNYLEIQKNIFSSVI